MVSGEVQDMPVVGGPRHGQVITASSATAYKMVEELPQRVESWWDTGTVFTTTTYWPWKFIATLPGRTDRQRFTVLARGSTLLNSDARDAVLKAWASGWAPDDEGEWAP